MTSSSTSAACVTLQKLSKSFSNGTSGPILALDNVSIAIGQGEFVSLIGPTGSGKTTLINLIAGFESPSSGSVALGKGIRPGDGLACVFQHYTLFPWHSVLHNVSFGLQMRGVRRKRRHYRAHEWLERVGLEEFAHHRPHELSGGMRQRAALVQALITEPHLLLLDEPFGALDLATRTELQGLLIDLWQEQKPTILFVTHNLDEAVLLADRVVVLSQRPGRVIEDIAIALPRPRDNLSEEFTDAFMTVRRSLGATTDVAEI
jgi:sulfonate transport system ATP-binding protein